MREDAAWSPILREQGALEELAAIGVEIIRNARNELYLSMRFLDVGLKWSVPRWRTTASRESERTEPYYHLRQDTSAAGTGEILFM